MVESHLFNRHKARVGKDKGAFGNADLTDEALQRVFVLVDWSAEQDAGEVGVNVAAGTEDFEQVLLAREPGQHTGFDVRGVRNIDELVAGDAGANRAVEAVGTKGDGHLAPAPFAASMAAR